MDAARAAEPQRPEPARLLALTGARPGLFRVTPEGRVVRRPSATETHLGGLALASRLVEELRALSE